ncbi:helix-turn-helix transcriptional regulator [Subtercola sp. RTI3]|uniref:helix-turn-helix domain-containing protein n=1 Tax=Subtercola sp. RTI3 TaxID=3048639 RepID=UPI002B22A612|nr:helix-turn-helix transcriptional regulator [Subtercola sp. RTI3]MEA9983693.1 helix-turn-helix transcriptional regulator [Subtercola sp. RTI3]
MSTLQIVAMLRDGSTTAAPQLIPSMAGEFRSVSGQIQAALGRDDRKVDDLAKSIGTSRATLHRRLANPGTLTLAEVATICLALSLKPSDLVASL